MRGVGTLFRPKTTVTQSRLEIADKPPERIRGMGRPAPENPRTPPQLYPVDHQLKGSNRHPIDRLRQASILLRSDPAEKSECDMEITRLMNSAAMPAEVAGDALQTAPGVTIRPEGKKESL